MPTAAAFWIDHTTRQWAPAPVVGERLRRTSGEQQHDIAKAFPRIAQFLDVLKLCDYSDGLPLQKGTNRPDYRPAFTITWTTDLRSTDDTQAGSGFLSLNKSPFKGFTNLGCTGHFHAAIRLREYLAIPRTSLGGQDMNTHQQPKKWMRRYWQRIKTILHYRSNRVSHNTKLRVDQPSATNTQLLTNADPSLVLNHVPRSFKQADSPDRPVLERVSKIPDVLPCRLVMEVALENHNQFDRQEHRKVFELRWQQSHEVEKCKQIVEEYLGKKYLNDKIIYPICESYSIIEQIPQILALQRRSTDQNTPPIIASMLGGSRNPKRNSNRYSDRPTYIERYRYTEDISASAAWKEYLPIAVAKHLVENLDAIYLLEITLRYGSFDRHLDHCTKKKCSTDIKEVLTKNQVYTYDPNVWFVPGQFLNKYFDKDLIRHLIRQDVQLQQNVEWKTEVRDRGGQQMVNDFVEFVYDFGVRMFATCLYADLSLDHVYQLWRRKKEDTDIPLPRGDLPKEWGNEKDKFMDNQCRFRAHEFLCSNRAAKNFMNYPQLDVDKTDVFNLTSDADEDYEALVRIKKSVIMPFTSVEEIGRGGYSTVYKVWIHEQHHAFTPDRRQPFAMKEFYKPGDDEDFEKEKNVCQQLAELPHEHLTPFLSAWEYQGHFYMLFPLANSDLHHYLKETDSPKSKTMKVQWLLQQMLGLARGLHHLHNLQPRESKESRSRGHRARTGIHHDLKPGNVLVFGDDATLKISDFGLARIRERISRDVRDAKSPQSKQPVGDWEYAAPETEQSGHVPSRSTDIWSLGCIYLVMLLWFFGHPDNIEAFREQRRADGVAGDTISSTAFWYVKPGQTSPVLKDVVLKRLNWLQKKAASKLVFRDLVRLIKEHMLCPHEPKERIKVLEVRSELKGLLLRARLDMRNDMNFFDDPDKGHGHIPFSLQSTVGDQTTVYSDREDTLMARNNDFLDPNTVGLTHSRCSSGSRRRVTEEMTISSGDQFVSFDDSASAKNVGSAHGGGIVLPNGVPHNTW